MLFAGAVDTNLPTQPGKNFSHVVEYYVEDFSKNAAPIARRLIRIVCPDKESYCIHPDTALPACTTDGICGKPAALSSSVSLLSGLGVAGSSSGTSSSMSTAAAFAASLTAPKLSLAASGAAEVPPDGLYDRCAPHSILGALCELGVTAMDVVDGNLDREVRVCGSRWVAHSTCTMTGCMLCCNWPTWYTGPPTFSINISCARFILAREMLCAQPLTYGKKCRVRGSMWVQQTAHAKPCVSCSVCIKRGPNEKARICKDIWCLNNIGRHPYGCAPDMSMHHACQQVSDAPHAFACCCDMQLARKANFLDACSSYTHHQRL